MTEQKDNQFHFEPLVPNNFKDNGRLETHLKAMTETVKGYPDRFVLAPSTTWQTLDRQNYHPTEYEDERFLSDTPPAWADPQDISQVTHDFTSYEGEVKFDRNGRPLNPIGPTGLEGRGLLGKWGANFAADPIVTRVNDSGFLEMITITRKDSGEFAIPGGMVDKGEKITETLKRELCEETSAELDFEDAVEVYKGYVDDPRNTDNSWMETDAFHLHLPDSANVNLKGQDDAIDAKWKVIDKEFLEKLYASHAFNVKKAIALWQKREGKVVDINGNVTS